MASPWLRLVILKTQTNESPKLLTNMEIIIKSIFSFFSDTPKSGYPEQPGSKNELNGNVHQVTERTDDVSIKFFSATSNKLLNDYFDVKETDDKGIITKPTQQIKEVCSKVEEIKSQVISQGQSNTEGMKKVDVLPQDKKMSEPQRDISEEKVEKLKVQSQCEKINTPSSNEISPKVQAPMVQVEQAPISRIQAYPIVGYSECKGNSCALNVFKVASGIPVISFVPGLIEIGAGIFLETSCNNKLFRITRGILSTLMITAPFVILMDTTATVAREQASKQIEVVKGIIGPLA